MTKEHQRGSPKPHKEVATDSSEKSPSKYLDGHMKQTESMSNQVACPDDKGNRSVSHHSPKDVFQPISQNYEQDVSVMPTKSSSMTGNESSAMQKNQSKELSNSGSSGSDAQRNHLSDADNVTEAPSESSHATTEDHTGKAAEDLKKSVYLNLMSSMSAPDAAHRLVGLSTRQNRQQVVHHLVETCQNAKNYQTMFGATAIILARLRDEWKVALETEFRQEYDAVHELTTSQIRNTGDLFGEVLGANALSWDVWECVALTPAQSTPSNRIFLQALLGSLKQELGVATLQKRLYGLQASSTRFLLPLPIISGSNPANSGADLDATRFAINFFVAIGMPTLAQPLRVALRSREGGNRLDKPRKTPRKA